MLLRVRLLPCLRRRLSTLRPGPQFVMGVRGPAAALTTHGGVRLVVVLFLGGPAAATTIPCGVPPPLFLIPRSARAERSWEHRLATFKPTVCRTTCGKRACHTIAKTKPSKYDCTQIFNVVCYHCVRTCECAPLPPPSQDITQLLSKSVKVMKSNS